MATKKKLPPKGGTSASKPKAVAQRTATAVRQRVTQDVATLRALGENMKRNQARDARQIPADKSPSVRRVGPGGANPKPQSKLPPGQKGGAIVKAGGNKPTTSKSNGGPVQQVRVRDVSKPNLPPGQRGGAVAARSSGARSTAAPKPSASTPATRALPPGQRGGAVATRPGAASRPTASTPKPTAGGRINIGGLRGGLIGLVGGMAADAVGRMAGESIGGFLRNQTNQSRNDPRRNTPGGRSNPGRSSGKPATDGRYIPGSQQTEIKDRSGRQSNASRPEAPKLPAAVTRSSSGGSSSTPSRGGSTQRKGSSSSSGANSSSTSSTPAKPGQKWDDFNPNRGTSKTNNPLMKDLVARMKDREDRDQASKASKLTSKFNTESNFSGEKVDGSKVDTKAKMSSTTSEYDKKKRRYGG